MIDRPPGSWIADADGNLAPNLADEAMKERNKSAPQAGLDEQAPGHNTGGQAQSAFDERPSGLDASSFKRSVPQGDSGAGRQAKRSSSEAHTIDKEEVKDDA